MKKESWRWAFMAIVILLFAILLYWVNGILAPFLLAFGIAYLLNPLVEWLERKGAGRRLAIAFVFSGILLVLALTILLILPVLYTELAKLSVVLPSTIEGWDKRVHQLRDGFRSTGLPNRVATVFDENLAKWEEVLVQKLQAFLGNLPEMLASVGIFLLSPILSIYFLLDWKRLHNGFLRLMPPPYRLEWQRLWQDINHVVRRFLRGNLAVAVIVGVLIGLGIKLIGMDYALLIGLICGIFDLIPYFGPIIGAVPSVLLGLTKSPEMALKVALVILIVQQLEGNVISPKLMGDSVGLHPLWVVFALMAGGKMAGVWGMLLAVPLAAVLRVVFRHIYFRLVSPEI